MLEEPDACSASRANEAAKVSRYWCINFLCRATYVLLSGDQPYLRVIVSFLNKVFGSCCSLWDLISSGIQFRQWCVSHELELSSAYHCPFARIETEFTKGLALRSFLLRTTFQWVCRPCFRLIDN